MFFGACGSHLPLCLADPPLDLVTLEVFSSLRWFHGQFYLRTRGRDFRGSMPPIIPTSGGAKLAPRPSLHPRCLSSGCSSDLTFQHSRCSWRRFFASLPDLPPSFHGRILHKAPFPFKASPGGVSRGWRSRG